MLVTALLTVNVHRESRDPYRTVPNRTGPITTNPWLSKHHVVELVTRETGNAMMTLTRDIPSTNLTTDALDALDFEPTIPCETVRHDGDEPARYVMVTLDHAGHMGATVGLRYPVCESCHTYWIRRWGGHCPCGLTVPHSDVMRIVTVI